LDGFKWALVALYDPAQPDHKENFLAELVQMGSQENLPLIMGGDFNILQHQSEKNSANYYPRWPFLFNAVIVGLNLREHEMMGRKLTWANNLASPTFEKLDRILTTTEWVENFPLSTVIALTREISDLAPLLLNTGGPNANTQPMFGFELVWLLQDGFIDMIREIWSTTTFGHTPMERRQGKFRRVRQYLKGWTKNISGQYKKDKKEILSTLDKLDKKAERVTIELHEIDYKQFQNNRQAELLHEEEIKWYQRAKVMELLVGDSDTKYFHLIANGKHRKTWIFQLQHEDNTIEGDEALIEYVTNYYKELFSAPTRNSFTLDETRVDDINQVTGGGK
jgi:hypothetical protein